MRLLGAAALLLAATGPTAAAEWKVGAAPSDLPDLAAASVTNEKGDQLYLWEQHGEGIYRVFAELHLGMGGAFGSEMPTYRVDGSAPIDTDAIRKAGEAQSLLTGAVREKVAFWLLWSSKEEVIRAGDPLHALLQGDELTVTFRAKTGGTDTATFPLTDADEKILAATRLRLEP